MRIGKVEMLQKVSALGTLKRFENSELDLNLVVRALLDEPDQPRRSSKNVIKALAKAFMVESTLKGRTASHYSQAVEMLAYATICAPLLEPDQLVRVIDLTSSTQVAYDPRSLLDAADTLKRVVSRYGSERRERLLKDLWVQSHQPHALNTEVAPMPVSTPSVYGWRSGLTEDAFRLEYEKASLFERVLYSSSPHFTADDTTNLLVGIVEAEGAVRDSYKTKFLSRVRAWSPRADQEEVFDLYHVTVDEMERMVLDASISPGEFVAHGIFADRHILGDEMRTLSRDVLNEVLGSSGFDSLWKVGMLARTEQLNMPPEVFRALNMFGSNFVDPNLKMPFSALAGMETLWRRILQAAPDLLPAQHPVLQAAVDTADPVVQSRLAGSTDLRPLQRPLSLIPDLVAKAAAAQEALPEIFAARQPREWMDLAGAASLIPFPYPDPVLSLDGAALLGLEGVLLTLLKNPATLEANANHMGNCTNSYQSHAAVGGKALFYFVAGGIEHNAELLIEGSSSYRAGSVDTRFNNGSVHPEVENAFRCLVAGLNT